MWGVACEDEDRARVCERWVEVLLLQQGDSAHFRQNLLVLSQKKN